MLHQAGRKAAKKAVKMVVPVSAFATVMQIIIWATAVSRALPDLLLGLAFSLVFLPLVAFPIAFMYAVSAIIHREPRASSLAIPPSLESPDPANGRGGD